MQVLLLYSTRQATNRMQRSIKEEDNIRQEMNQKQSSSNSFAFTTRTVRPYSLQYLDDQNNPSIPIKIQNDISEPFQRDAQLSKSSKQSKVPVSCKKSSIYHNFQKHLITTLKLHVNFNNCRRSNTAVDHLMVELWEYFLKSNRPTKRYLYSLLMNIPENIIEFKNKYRDKTHQEEFLRIITEATHEDLIKAQKNLRFYLMKQCKKLVENGQLDHRRMQKIDEFKEYFNTFIHDLEMGELNLRLPKPNRAQKKTAKKTPQIKRARSKKKKDQ